MFSLRLTQLEEGQDNFRVEVELEGGGQPRQSATARFGFTLAPHQQENLRWYLEDYLQYPLQPAPQIAARIEGQIRDLGTQIFRSVFHSADDARDLWATLRTHLNDTRVEIVTNVVQATAIPWELIRDPKTDTALALGARAFVRAHPQAALPPRLPETDRSSTRILLVICRPGGGGDVPFRSVANRLLQELGGNARARFEFDVLRPPTFNQLGKTLRTARDEGRPYQIVHFDGHGVTADVEKDKTPRRLLLRPPRIGAHGYLLFENADVGENCQLVDGPSLGSLLVEAGVPYLVLNACRSAHAGVRTEPDPASVDLHTRVRALGSLAQETMDAGVLGVVAMRYSVYVVTAAQFVGDLYKALVQGYTLGEAVTLGRKQLHDQPLREIAFEPRPLQDWSVPVVYEAAPVVVFPGPQANHNQTPDLAPESEMGRKKLDPGLPPRPDIGFFGRDETLLALDRAFDKDRIVLLWAYAGSGKTTAAVEFLRWYALTGGLRGQVLFTSFQHRKTLTQVLNDAIEGAFGPALERQGINWLALNDSERLSQTLQILRNVPTFWIWDNVEPVAGFPTGTVSQWNPDEQKQLRDFLRAASDIGAPFLLTSRRDEEMWLGELPTRVTLPPMPFQERAQLARSLAEKRGRKLSEVEDWRPLLEFTRGNPLTITVLVSQALREGLRSRKDIESFVARLRAGENAFEDEASEGRAKSLGASLSYGFENAFGDPSRRQIALLYFFQQIVNIKILTAMGSPESKWCVPEIRGLTHETWTNLLDRAAEVGLLTQLGRGLYSVHPALPWYFRDLFERHYPTAPAGDSGPSPRDVAMHAFTESVAELGESCLQLYQRGDKSIVMFLAIEEPNLIRARELAKSREWWGAVMGAMQGPLSGREHEWRMLMDYCIRLAQESQNWAEAERYQRIDVKWRRQVAARVLDANPKTLDHDGRNAIRSLAVALNELGLSERETGNADCKCTFEEVINLSKRIGDYGLEAVASLNLGVAYVTLDALYDLDKAEQCYRHGLDLVLERDTLTRSKYLSELGFIYWARFNKAQEAQQPKDELERYFNDARGFYEAALSLTPPDALASLAVKHNALGQIYGRAGLFDESMLHYRKAILYLERSGDLFNAGKTRLGAAQVLRNAHSPQDALDYAYSALDNLKQFNVIGLIRACEELIARLEREIKEKQG